MWNKYLKKGTKWKQRLYNIACNNVQSSSMKSSSVSMSLSIAKFPVLIWHLYLGDEVQLFYLHMNMGLQQLVKKHFDSFSFHAQLGAFFIWFYFLFAFSFSMQILLWLWGTSSFFIFKGLHICLKAFQYFRFKGCKNPKTFLIKFVGTFLARFMFASFCKCICIILLNSILNFWTLSIKFCSCTIS